MKKLVGLTGKTGAGKSTVSAYLKQKGAYIIDGDIIAREIFEINKSLLPKLCEAFGWDILENDGVSLNRKALARKAFSTPENTALLNSIMHPAINEEIKKRVGKAFLEYNTVIVDAAAIIESGFADECDMLLVVHAPESVRKERIIKRDNLTEEDALVRIKGQKDDSFYLEKATYIVSNFGDNDFKKQVDSLIKELFN